MFGRRCLAGRDHRCRSMDTRFGCPLHGPTKPSVCPPAARLVCKSLDDHARRACMCAVQVPETHARSTIQAEELCAVAQCGDAPATLASVAKPRYADTAFLKRGHTDKIVERGTGCSRHVGQVDPPAVREGGTSCCKIIGSHVAVSAPQGFATHETMLAVCPNIASTGTHFQSTPSFPAATVLVRSTSPAVASRDEDLPQGVCDRTKTGAHHRACK